MRARRFGLAVGALALLGALSGCSTSVESGDLEEEITTQVEAAGSTVEDIECPDDLEGEEGATADCTATIDGEEGTVRATVTSVDGNEVSFDIAPVE